MTPVKLMRLINFWPPLLFAGIHVISFEPDMRNVEVGLRLTWWNHNKVGTQFGGNIYSMTDPFYPLMLMANLGPGYTVWDQSAQIEFIKPGTTRLRAKFNLSESELSNIRQNTAGDRKYLSKFMVEITDANGLVVATVNKVIYIRPKRPSAAAKQWSQKTS
jgi:acyl-coenzyme A thioesterase PaaI-like protein